MNFDDITLDDVKKVESKPSQPVEQVKEQKVEQPAEQPEQEAEAAAPTEPKDNVSTPSFDWKEKTGGAYEDFDSLWNELNELKTKKTEVKEVEKQPDWKDDYIKKAVDYYNDNGDLTPFLEETRFNYDEMSDKEVLRKNMRDKYKGLSSTAFEKKFEQYVENTFNPDEDEDYAAEMMKYEANKVRDELKQRQQDFLKPKEQTKVDTDQPDLDAQLREWEKQVKSNEAVQNLMKEKALKFKYGEEEFTYEIDSPDAIIEQAVNNNKFWENFVVEKDGGVDTDIARFTKVAQYAKNPEDYEKRLIEFGMSLGKSDVFNELENPTEIKTPTREGDGSASGDWKDEFFQAVKNSRK